MTAAFHRLAWPDKPVLTLGRGNQFQDHAELTNRSDKPLKFHLDFKPLSGLKVEPQTGQIDPGHSLTIYAKYESPNQSLPSDRIHAPSRSSMTEAAWFKWRWYGKRKQPLRLRRRRALIGNPAGRPLHRFQGMRVSGFSEARDGAIGYPDATTRSRMLHFTNTETPRSGNGDECHAADGPLQYNGIDWLLTNAVRERIIVPSQRMPFKRQELAHPRLASHSAQQHRVLPQLRARQLRRPTQPLRPRVRRVLRRQRPQPTPRAKPMARQEMVSRPRVRIGSPCRCLEG